MNGAQACPPTRGLGLFESFLARMRARQANRLIPSSLRNGSILDVGCGSYPYFLSHTSFASKFGVDQQQVTNPVPDIQLEVLNLNQRPTLPFGDGMFNAVTLLAVMEHLDPENVVRLYDEIYRVLTPGGLVVVTTPASWSDGLLRTLARLRLVSPEEINEHVFTYTPPLIGWYFGRAGFSMNKIHFGYFEFGLNLWAVAQK